MLPVPSSSVGDAAAPSSCSGRDRSAPIAFRTLRYDTDLSRLKELHGICFPIAYDDRFYNWLASTHCIGLVATTPDVGMAGGNGCSAGHRNSMQEEGVGDAQTACPPGASAPAASDCVVGFVIGRIKYIEGPWLTTPVVYISTIGVDPDMRQRGIGHELLERFASMVTDPAFLDAPACDAFRGPPRGRLASLLCRLSKPKPLTQIWLHCLADDAEVVQFYTRRGFLLVEKLRDYYEFGGRFHDAYVLVREQNMHEDARCAGRRKGNPKGTRRAWQSRTVWEILAGSSASEALQTQDELEDPAAADVLPAGGSGRHVSSAAWCLLTSLVVGCAGLVVLIAHTVWS